VSASRLQPLVLTTVVLFQACCSMAPAPRTKLELVVPREGQVVGGPGVLLLASSSLGQPTFRPAFEISLNGRIFTPLDPEPAPDFGPDGFASTLNATLFPSGPLWIRVREGRRRAGPVQVRVNQLPKVACSALSRGREVTVDCSASSDLDGGITAYEYRFGDDKPEREPVPSTRSAESLSTHRYDRAGTFTLRVTAYDDLGMWDTWRTIIQVPEEASSVIEVGYSDSCGCRMLLLTTSGMSDLEDPWRPNASGGFDHAPLGPDPDFPRTNFDIVPMFTPRSNPELCEEGQEVRATGKKAGGPAEDKHACSSGQPLPSCPPHNHAFCNTHTCDGGSMAGQSCDGIGVTPWGFVDTKAELCRRGLGTCRSNRDGSCTAYPFTGGRRGNDDYRKHYPGDVFAKFLCAWCSVDFPTGSPIGSPEWAPQWFDGPGRKTPAAHATFNYRFDGDFLAWVRGPKGNCECHFRVTVDWVADANPQLGGNQPGHRPGGASGITLLRDAETTRNCRLIQ
jgi:PKD domain